MKKDKDRDGLVGLLNQITVQQGETQELIHSKMDLLDNDISYIEKVVSDNGNDMARNELSSYLRDRKIMQMIERTHKLIRIATISILVVVTLIGIIIVN